ncbi:hypothetical protein G6F46_013038 [Rhizopus delemar]|nr:hypothetical protein G6F46_013038 [Rhizopus delemar]
MSEVQHLSISLWNANGLRTTTVHEVLSHCLSSTLLFITETWLLSPSLLPTDWMQYHVYGVPVPSANRGSMGVTALVSPSCPFPISQLPSPNRCISSVVMAEKVIFRDCCYDIWYLSCKNSPVSPETVTGLT